MNLIIEITKHNHTQSTITQVFVTGASEYIIFKKLYHSYKRKAMEKQPFRLFHQLLFPKGYNRKYSF